MIRTTPWVANTLSHRDIQLRSKLNAAFFFRLFFYVTLYLLVGRFHLRPERDDHLAPCLDNVSMISKSTSKELPSALRSGGSCTTPESGPAGMNQYSNGDALDHMHSMDSNHSRIIFVASSMTPVDVECGQVPVQEQHLQLSQQYYNDGAGYTELQPLNYSTPLGDLSVSQSGGYHQFIAEGSDDL